MRAASPVPFAIVGTGYRARLIARIATRLPDRFALTGMLSRSPDANAPIRQVADLDDLLAAQPAFVLTAVPVRETPSLIEELVRRRARVLAETPPAPDLAGLRRLWEAVGASGLVQVAEQYPRHPMTAARLSALRGGRLGRVTSASVSLTQTYHAVAILRAALGVADAAAEVRAVAHRSPLVAPWSRAGWTRDPEPHETVTTLATLDFGDALGVYDFTEGQTRNPLRSFRFLARGTIGELSDERLVRLGDPETVLQSSLERRELGGQQDYEDRELLHIALDGEPLWRNAFVGGRLSDEELGIADLLAAMGRWAIGNGPAPYPLAEAAQDHLLGLAIAEAAATGAPVRTPPGSWR